MKVFFALLFGLQYFTIYAQDEIDFVQQASYSKMVMSLDDLNEIIADINYYVVPDTLLTDTIERIFTRRLITVANDNKNLTYKKFVTVPNTVINKENFTSLKIEYLALNKPISNIEISFHDYERKLRITGNDQRKVEDLFNKLDVKFDSYTSMLGKIDFNLIFFMVGLLLAIILTGVLITAIQMPNRPQSVTIFLLFGVPITILILWFIFSFLPGGQYSRWFPKFLLQNEKISWIDRNANNMEFFGFVALIISGLWGFIKLFSRNKNATLELEPKKNEE